MKRILLSTDGSHFARSSAAYIADLYSGVADVKITVLNVLPSIPPLYLEESHDPLIAKHYKMWQETTLKDARKYIKEAVDLFHKEGFDKNRIHARYAEQVKGVARDIVRETDAGDYDACVVGKKGMGWFDDTFLGSITSKLLEISENHPVWLVSGSKWNSRNVLVAMDYTPKVIDLSRYVGKMLQGLREVKIRFFHYCTPFTENLPLERSEIDEILRRTADKERVQMEHYFTEALEILMDLGFDKKNVHYDFEIGKSASTRKVSERILEKTHEGESGTLVIARKGATGAQEFRLGSVASRIATESQNCAVWIV